MTSVMAGSILNVLGQHCKMLLMMILFVHCVHAAELHIVVMYAITNFVQLCDR